jgi:effector-binding domain-containing protein
METKQTAVEWFAQEAILLHFNHATKTLPTKVFEVAYMKLINQAKQMEKEQIGDWVETHWYEEIKGKNFKLYYNKNNEK